MIDNAKYTNINNEKVNLVNMSPIKKPITQREIPRNLV